jgi:hypothetical protein
MPRTGGWFVLQNGFPLLLLTPDPPGKCPTLNPLSDTSTGDLPPLPPTDHVSQLMNTVLFLDVTQSKLYSSHTRTLLWSFSSVDEHAVVSTLKNPDEAVKEAQRKTDKAKDEQAARGKSMRYAAMGLGAVAGGALIGVTGGCSSYHLLALHSLTR